MSERKDPRPGNQAETGAGIESRCRQRQHGEQCTITTTEMQERILSCLRVGVENALTLSDLTSVTGFDPRAIRREIHKARRDGVPVLSDCEHGYFFPSSAVEKRRFVRSMKHRAKEILAVARAVESGAAVSL